MIRAFLATAAVVAVVVLSGCCPRGGLPSESRQTPVPIKSGILVSGTLWSQPVGSSGQNTGNSPKPGSRIEVYDGFIAVTESEGTQRLCPHGWYTDLRFKQD